jgi:hypothetical protein
VLWRGRGGSDGSKRDLEVEQCSVTCTQAWKRHELVYPRRPAAAENWGFTVAPTGAQAVDAEVDKRQEGASYSRLLTRARMERARCLSVLGSMLQWSRGR